jgi:MFS family permease
MTHIRHLRWYIVDLLFFASVISYVDRQTLSVNAPYIRDDLGLSITEYSSLVIAFLVAYTIGPILTGRRDSAMVREAPTLEKPELGRRLGTNNGALCGLMGTPRYIAERLQAFEEAGLDTFLGCSSTHPSTR